MNTILSLKPKVTRAEALARLLPGGLTGVLRSLSRGPLRLLADVYVPFRVYRVEVHNGGRRQSQWLGLDAVCGTLDLYKFERVPLSSEMVRLETRNCPGATLAEARGSEILAEKVRRLIFLNGFFGVRDLNIRAERVPLELHIPYWVGFYGQGERAHITMLDASRGRFEGAKARNLLQDWLQG